MKAYNQVIDKFSGGTNRHLKYLMPMHNINTIIVLLRHKIECLRQMP